MITSTTRRTMRRTALVALLPFALGLAACSDSTEANAGTAEPSASASSEAGTEQGGPGAQRAPGVTGEIAAVSGTTAQVQDGESQTAVTWSADTAITLTQTGSVSDVAEGSCVVVIGGEDEAASSVTVSDPADGECTGGLAGFDGGSGGQPPSGAPDGESGERPTGEPSDGEDGDRPSGAPEDLPSGTPESGEPGGEGPGAIGSIVVGQVVSADATSLTVTTTADGTESEQTVTIDDATVFSVQRSAGSEDVEAGLCVSAQGETDDAGGLAATTLTLSEPGDEGCVAAGAGGFGGGPDQAGQGAGAPQDEATGTDDGDA